MRLGPLYWAGTTLAGVVGGSVVATALYLYGALPVPQAPTKPLSYGECVMAEMKGRIQVLLPFAVEICGGRFPNAEVDKATRFLEELAKQAPPSK